MENHKLAIIAYNAYCDKVSWKSIRGEPLPAFQQMPVTIQQAWIAAMIAVKDEIAIKTN